jgi:outer membrane protein assembly factor BamD
MRIGIVVIMMLFLASCAIFGPPTELDDTKGLSAERIYEKASAKMADKDYKKSVEYLKKLESRYPNSKYGAQAKLDMAYAYYKQQDAAQCVSTVERFIKIHPNHPNLDYAYYLKGVAYFKERGLIEKVTFQDISDRDPKVLKQSFLAFKDLLTLYPNTRYGKDATERMIESYPDSSFIEEALVIMISAYDNLGMNDLKEDNLRILKQNYPNSSMFTKGKDTKKQDWWKFWDKD